MGENTKIQWCHHTMNPWIGCAKVSAGCTNCYAENETPARVSLARGLPLWGPKAFRQVTGAEYWRKPLAWNAAAKAAGERHRVFCASMADVFELPMDLEQQIKVGAARVELWKLIKATPDLDWLILTKRPENIRSMLPLDWVDGYPNVWLGVSCEDQERADERIPLLLQVPAAVRFISAEPLLGGIKLARSWLAQQRGCEGQHRGDGSPECPRELHHHHDDRCGPRLDWAIVGGESGPGARPCDVEWIRDIVQHCKDSKVAVFVKQLGAVPHDKTVHHHGLGVKADGYNVRYHLKHKKGGDMAEWPESLRVREFPRSG